MYLTLKYIKWLVLKKKKKLLELYKNYIEVVNISYIKLLKDKKLAHIYRPL
jgi:hypothetical protein